MNIDLILQIWAENFSINMHMLYIIVTKLQRSSIHILKDYELVSRINNKKQKYFDFNASFLLCE